MTTIQSRLTDLEDEDKVPRWWSKHQESTESRLTSLESRMNTTQTYLEQILQAVLKQGGDSSPDTAAKTTGPHQPQTAKTGQAPTVITISDDKERYSYKPEGPGLLASKPLHTPPPPLKLKMKMDESIKDEPLFQNLGNSSTHSGTTHTNTFRPKIELQMFDGANPRGWVKRCQKYFSLLNIPEEQKMDIAAMHLEGKAETWFDGYILQKHRINWPEFAADLCHRFCDRTYTDVIEEFNKLIQKTSVEDYQERFEELKPFMIQQNPHLEETYFVSSFLSGLKEELRHRVKIHQPQSLNEAYRQAKLHELSLEIESKKFRPKPYSFTNPQMTTKPVHQSSPAQQKPTTTNTNQTANRQTLLEYRRANNLCYKCGERFAPGHQYKNRQLNSMEDMEQTETKEGTTDNEEDSYQLDKPMEEELEISINALTGNVGHSTLRLLGTIKGRHLSILVDSGSTHSFINPGWAKEGVEILSTTPLVITVANGEKLYSEAKAKQLLWKMQGHQFQHDFRVLTMGGSDMVLGVDWMKKYSPVSMDFNNMTLSFYKDTELIILKGGNPSSTIQCISGNRFQKLAEKEMDLIGEMYLLTTESIESAVHPKVQQILQKYETVFQEPTSMPPTREHDHAIILKEGTQPVNLRPYRFPHH
ncbi:hypothetical protein GQ457_11G022560 [Hibiscus cannabinus]